MGKGFESGGGGAGAAGTAAELAVGFGLAQQMMRDGFMSGHAAPTVVVPPVPTAGAAAGASGLPELLSPAEAAQALGVSEADVMTVLESGDLKGKKIGSTWRISRAALNDLHVPVTARSADREIDQIPPREARVPGLRRAGRVESRPSRSWCARSAERSRRTRSIASTGKVVELDLVKALRELPDEERGWQTARRSVQCQSLPRGHGVRSGARRPELRVLRLAGARRLPGDQGADPPAGRAAVQDRREPRARRHPPLVAQPSGSRPGRLARRRARRHGSQPLHSVLDLRRAGALPVDGRGRLLLLRRWCRAATAKGRPIMRQERRDALGAGVRRGRSRSSTTSRCRGRRGCRSICCGRSSRFRRRRSSPYDTAFLSGHVVEHYQVVLLDAAQQSQEQMHAKLAGAVRAAGARRHPPQPAASIPTTRAARSSTSSCRSGCCRTTTARRRIR